MQADTKVYDSKAELAEAVAKRTVDTLKKTVDEHGNAAWVLSGGTTPHMAYGIVAANHADDLDWSKVTLVMGDERIGPAESTDNNWHAIDQIIGDLPTQKLVPKSDQSAEDAARDYEQLLSDLPKADNGLPRFDVVWLGIGEDGHTLSLFPGHTGLLPSGGLVSPIHGAPKPPHDRISLSLRALIGTQLAFILASGKEKCEAVKKAMDGGGSPMALAISIIKTHGGSVTWFLDKDAAP